MSRIMLGVICGLVFGAIDTGIMLPMSFPDKTAAITAAFIARFGIGLVIGAVRLPWPGWAVGLIFGLLLSIPDAIITKAYGPIIGMGAIGGTVIRFLVSEFGRCACPLLRNIGMGLAVIVRKICLHWSFPDSYYGSLQS